jgi:hypothetical protein
VPRTDAEIPNTRSRAAARVQDFIVNRPATPPTTPTTPPTPQKYVYRQRRSSRTYPRFRLEFPAANPPTGAITNLQPHRWLPQRSMSRSSRSALRSSSVTRVTASTAQGYRQLREETLQGPGCYAQGALNSCEDNWKGCDKIRLEGSNAMRTQRVLGDSMEQSG